MVPARLRASQPRSTARRRSPRRPNRRPRRPTQTSDLTFRFVTRSITAPAPAPTPAPTEAEASGVGGKIKPTNAPPTGPTTAPMPGSFLVSLTWIFPSSSRFTQASASTRMTSSAYAATHGSCSACHRDVSRRRGASDRQRNACRTTICRMPVAELQKHKGGPRPRSLNPHSGVFRSPRRRATPCCAAVVTSLINVPITARLSSI